MHTPARQQERTHEPATLTAAHCNTLQHTVTYCNTLQHTVTLCSIPPIASRKGRTNQQHALHLTTTHCNTPQHNPGRRQERTHEPATRTATYCNTLQHTAAHCNTLQHTTTHYNIPPIARRKGRANQRHFILFATNRAYQGPYQRQICLSLCFNALTLGLH